MSMAVMVTSRPNTETATMSAAGVWRRGRMIAATAHTALTASAVAGPTRSGRGAFHQPKKSARIPAATNMAHTRATTMLARMSHSGGGLTPGSPARRSRCSSGQATKVSAKNSSTCSHCVLGAASAAAMSLVSVSSKTAWRSSYGSVSETAPAAAPVTFSGRGASSSVRIVAVRSVRWR